MITVDYTVLFLTCLFLFYLGLDNGEPEGCTSMESRQGSVLFRKGEILRKVPEADLVGELFKEIDSLLAERYGA